MAVVAVTNVERDVAGVTQTSQVSASKAAAPANLKVIMSSMVAVSVAAVGMWLAYRYAIKPTTIGVAQNYVPYAGVLAAAAALEGLLEPLSQLLMPSSKAKATAAASKTTAQAAAANPAMNAMDVQPVVQQPSRGRYVAYQSGRPLGYREHLRRWHFRRLRAFPS